jgi:hypothetical protein
MFIYQMTKSNILWATIFIALFPFVEISSAQQTKKEPVECQPVYGHYWRSYKWGWYGAPREVRTPVEAKEIIEQFLAHDNGIRVVRMREKAHFYIAEIMNNRGVLVDLILIDKRTGRIRSMF